MLTSVRLVLVAAVAAPLLAGCGRDPLVNGPFLIGAKRPDVRDGTCVPSESMRSQDAHGDWVSCPVERTYGRPVTQTPVVEQRYVEDPAPAQPARRRAATASATDYGSDPRSAW